MKTIKKFRGATLQQAKDGTLYVRFPYRGLFPVKVGDTFNHQLGRYTVTPQDKQSPGETKC